MSKKTLLLIIPNLGTGGAQKVFREHLTFLSTEYAVYGCVFNWDGAAPEERTSGLYSLNVPAGRGPFSKLYYFLQRVSRLRKLKRDLNVDISISHLEGADYVNILSRVKDKTVCWIHGTKKFDENIEGKLGWIRKRILIPLLYNRASRLVTVSIGIMEELSSDFGIPGKQMETIYNGFDITHIQRLSQEPTDEMFANLSEHKLLITHCRLARQKNLSGLINLFRFLQKDSVFKLVIIGDGELRERVLEDCSRVGLKVFDVWSGVHWNNDSDVFMLGYHKNPFRYLSKSTAYIMSSGWEGFPLALCEAMACGLPVLSTDCYTGPREIIAPSLTGLKPVEKVTRGEFGVLLPLLKPEVDGRLEYCADELRTILENETILNQYRTLSRSRVKDFSLEKTRQAVLTLMRSI